MPEHYREEEAQIRIQTLEPGDTFTSGPWVVSSGVVEVFLSLLGITHPVFFSDDYAREWGFKSRISTGILTFAQLMAALGRSGFLYGGIYLGTDKCRHILPVYPGDIMRAQVEVMSRRTSSRAGCSR